MSMNPLYSCMIPVLSNEELKDLCDTYIHPDADRVDFVHMFDREVQKEFIKDNEIKLKM